MPYWLMCIAWVHFIGGLQQSSITISKRRGQDYMTVGIKQWIVVFRFFSTTVICESFTVAMKKALLLLSVLFFVAGEFNKKNL